MGSLVKGVTNIVGGILEPFTGAKATQQAAAQAAQSQAQAAQLSANVAAFRPVGITSRFGTSAFGYQDIGGVPRLSSASYTPSPEIANIREALLALAPTSLGYLQGAAAATEPLTTSAGRLFGLGEQYLAESPEAMRQRYYNEQQALLAPTRQQEEARLASSVFGRGRGGLNVGMIGQPELRSLAEARRMQDLQLAAQAEQAAQERIGFGSSLFGTGAGLLGTQYQLPAQALGPLQSLLGMAGTVEEMGQQSYQLGLQAGGLAQPGATAAANLLGSGLAQAAQTRYQGVQAGNMANQAFLQAMMGAAAGGFGGGGGGAPTYRGQPWGGTPSNPWYG